MKQCILIDDEPLAIELLEDYIAKTEGFELLASFSNPIEALQYLQQHPADLIFLDVQMPELSGIQLMKILNRQYPIILTTAYTEYAIDGYEHEIVDYLLKPISYERFFRAVQKAGERSDTKAPNHEEPADDFIFVKSEYRMQKLQYDDILWMEGLGDYVAIHTTTGKILTLEKMKYFAEALPPQHFMRVHKSYLVSIPKIEFIERNRIVIGEQRIPISDTYKEAFWQRIRK